MIIKGAYKPWPGIDINLEWRKGVQTQTKRYPGNRDRWEIAETKNYRQGRQQMLSTELHLGTEHGVLLIHTRKTAWGPALFVCNAVVCPAALLIICKSFLM